MWKPTLRALRSRSSFILALGFSCLVILIGVLGVGAIRRARAIYHEMQVTQDAYLQTEASRRDIATDMYLADILVRDYLLDPSPQNAPRHREQLLQIRTSLQGRLDRLSERFHEGDNAGLPQLNEEVQKYWDSLDPIFDWTPEEKAQKSWVFLRRKVLPRRQAVVDLAREVARLNRENLERERSRIQSSQDTLRKFLLQITVVALGLGIVVATLTTYRVAILERRHDDQTRQIEASQQDLRRLSRKLVQAQESERKALSRELHDEVGQTLTALGMELGNLASIRNGDNQAFELRIEDLKRLNADAMRSLRDLAMGLRPSMLDDLGLEAALQWQGREFSRHTGVPATIQVNGTLAELSEAQRTCIYRVVQEALTNCARHASARTVLVAVSDHGSGVTVVVHDDGVGFDRQSSLRAGLGLISIQERVAALDGTVTITSERNRGTTVRVEIPVAVAA